MYQMISIFGWFLILCSWLPTILCEIGLINYPAFLSVLLISFGNIDHFFLLRKFWYLWESNLG